MNLCTNAAHAMENKGGMLEISLKDVTIENDELIGTGHLKFGNYIEIKISDTSYGINPQIINKIYEPKGQVWDSPLFFGIVEIYGGKINVESTVGKGTTFTIYLPTTKGQ